MEKEVKNANSIKQMFVTNKVKHYPSVAIGNVRKKFKLEQIINDKDLMFIDDKPSFMQE